MSNKEKIIEQLEEQTKLVQGWVGSNELIFLYHCAKNVTGKGCVVEIGSWKGKSTIWIAQGIKDGSAGRVYAIDPFAGSDGLRDHGDSTLTDFKNNINKAGVQDVVTPVVSTSEMAAKDWNKPIEFLFIDGAHEYEGAEKDFLLYSPHLIPGGVIAFHDTAPNLQTIFKSLLVSGIPGPRKVVEKYIFKSLEFKNIGIVGSITYATKCVRNSWIDRLNNKICLLYMFFKYTMYKLYSLSKNLPKPIKSLIKKIYRAWYVLTHEGFKPFFIKLREFYTLWEKRAVRILVYPYASWKLPKEAAKKHSIPSAISLIFDGFGRIFAPQQVRSEISGLCEIVEKAQPKTVLEIGTATGGSLFLFSRFVSPNANIISIDLPKGASGGFYAKLAESLYKKFKSPLQKMTLLRKDSHKKETVELLKSTTKNKEIDFLFIDGDHSYEGVKQDYELYSPLVKKGGIIAFHDVCKHRERCDADKFWDEIKVGKNCKELIENPNQNWAGIGVIFK